MKVFLLALSLAAGAFLFLFFVGKGGTPVEIVIPPGLSAVQTADLLEEKDVIVSAFLFQAAAKVSGYDRKLKPGTYLMRRGTPVYQALKVLKLGANNEVKVSIPEGFAAYQIADRLQANGVCSADEFLKYVQANRLEGYLFPTTYQMEPASGAEKAARRMHQEFKRQVEPEYEKADPKPNLSLHQVVTLASIVEREAVLPEEKPMIAAVYLNRLRKRKMLEADPTVQYALGYWKKGITLKDLKNPSPYNTYNHFGLPPGAICSPGLESLRGVLKPAKIDAIYFVADTRGGHRFSVTLEEHNKAKQTFKKDLKVIKERLRREAQSQR